jgi:lipopolysaccharide transport system ATP-binding protein
MSELRLSNLGKVYRVYQTPRDRLLELLTGRKRHVEHWALSDVNLDIAKGEAVGVIGNNGAGKSTLLKLIAGTLVSSSGKIEYKGRLTAILELGTGFHPDFTGCDNIFYAGALMGISRQELTQRYPDIVEFSELGDAVYQPIKTYSTGMVVRLAFSLVTMVDPQILVVDEALAVGDRNFQKKCIGRMIEIQKSGTTILFCSHSMHHVTQFCDRVLWLEDGRPRMLGEACQVVDQYIDSSMNDGDVYINKEETVKDAGSDLHCKVQRMTLQPENHIRRGETLNIRLQFNILKEDNYVLGVAVNRKDTSTRLVAETSLENGLQAVRFTPGEYSVTLAVATDALRTGQYIVFAGLMHESLLKVEDFLQKEIQVLDIDDNRSPSMIRTRVDWDVENKYFK